MSSSSSSAQDQQAQQEQQQQQQRLLDDEERKGRIKDYGRESRLSFKNFHEHQLRKEFKELAMEKCSLPIKAFAECSKEQGIMVVFNCREYQKDLNDCMHVYNSPEAFEKYKQMEELHQTKFKFK